MSGRKLGAPSGTAMIYIGKERYKTLDKLAREISFESGCTVRSSTLAQYLIDNFIVQARADLLKELNYNQSMMRGAEL